MYERILVPVDGSPTSSRGLDEAIKLAKLTSAHLRLVHVVDGLTFATGYEVYTGDLVGLMKEAGEKILGAALARAKAGGVVAETYLHEAFGGRVSDVIVEQARVWNADLIVLGTHGRRGVRRLLIGSDAEQILRAASVPVLLARAPEPDPVAPVVADHPTKTLFPHVAVS